MSIKSVKKDILNLAGELSPQFSQLLAHGGFSFCTEITNKTSFILVKDLKRTWEELEKSYKTIENDIIVVSLDAVQDKVGFYACNGRAILDLNVLADHLILKVVQRLFFTDSAVNLEYAYDGLLKKVFNFKLSGHLVLGHYLDSVAACAIEQDFDVILLRSFYVNALSFISYLQKAKICQFPIDVQYGYSESGFVLQFIVTSNSIYSEYLLTAMKDPDKKNPVNSLLTWCEQQTDFFDVYELKKSGKLVISGLWSKVITPCFSSVFINNISAFSFDIYNGLLAHFISGGPTSHSVSLEKKNLHGEGIIPLAPNFISQPEIYSLLLKHLIRAKGDDRNKNCEILTVKWIDQNLNAYEDQSLVENLNELDKEFLLDLLKNIEKNNMADLGSEDLLAFISKVQGEKKAQDGLTIIHGSKKEQKNDSQMMIIKGSSKESAQNNQLNFIKSLPSSIANRIDKEKLLEIRKSLMALMRSMLSEGKSYEEIEIAFVDKVSLGLDLSKEDSHLFVQRILGQMWGEMGSNDEIQKRDQQLLKMKKIVDIMKRELDIAKKDLSKVENKNIANDSSVALIDDKLNTEGLNKLQVENQTMNSVIEMLNKKISNLSESYDQLKQFGEEKYRELDLTHQKTLKEFEKLKSGNVDGVGPLGNSEYEKIIKDLKTEDANQKQLLSQSETTIKALEKKVKFLSEQLTAAQKIVSLNKANAVGSNSKSSDNKVKQLEIALEKITTTSDKMKNELTEKKKENLKLKTDMQVMQNKMQEIQRKMGVLEKKRAA